MDELRECPFCGSEAYLEHNAWRNAWGQFEQQVVCEKCKARTDFNLNASELWNRRHSPKPEALTEWISVEDRLPEDDALILAYHPNYLISTPGQPPHDVDRITIKFGWYCRGSSLGITHWMPLPTPPETEGD